MSDLDPNASAAPLKPAPRFTRAASTPVTLTDPIEFDGRSFATIAACNISIGEFRRHTESGGKGEVLSLPMFRDEQGAAVPAEVMDALSMRDAEALTEAAQSFLSKPSAETATSSPSANGETAPQP